MQPKVNVEETFRKQEHTVIEENGTADRSGSAGSSGPAGTGATEAAELLPEFEACCSDLSEALR